MLHFDRETREIKRCRDCLRDDEELPCFLEECVAQLSETTEEKAEREAQVAADLAFWGDVS